MSDDTPASNEDTPTDDTPAPTDADAITALDDRTVERIAAGEVVERPASVVKELVENSLDADASRVEVTVERGGKDLVRVRDDGVGMTRDGLEKAVEQHTTSKIRDADDLAGGVATLGFRGEALHTIGAVSRLTVRSKPRGGDVGTELRMAGGDVTAVEPTGCPEGTTVEVTDLFYNTPAREKYLKQDRTEFARVNDVVTKYALANPEVAVSLTHDGREVFATPGQGDLRGAILAVYGREVAENMLAVDGEAADADAADRASDESPEGPLDGVTGYVSHPETTRSSRDYVSTFVNGRYVRSAAVREAVVEAYGNQLAPDRYPFAVLFLDVPAADVDVNVHPRKMEVRWADEDGVREQVETAVREALLDHGLLRSAAPRGRSAPEETTIAPEREGEPAADDSAESPADGSAESPVDDGDGPPTDGSAESPADDSAGTASGPDRPTSESTGRAGDDPETPTGTERTNPDTAGGRTGAEASPQPTTGDADEARPADGADEARPADGPSEARPADERAPETDAGESSGRSTGSGPIGGGSDPGRTGTASDTRESGDAARKFGGTEQRTLDGESVSAEREFDSLPSLRVLGQYDDTYVVAAAPDGLVVVDQHAADERVNYERLRERFRGDTPTQALADPVELELTAGESEAFEATREALAQLGFQAERTGDRTVAVRSVPAVVADAVEPDLLQDVLARVVGEAGDPDAPVEARADELLADLACYPSVTGNTSLSSGSVVELLRVLDDCENPYACPHGRPTVVHVDDDELDERFERDYPGHAGRRE